MAVASDDSSVAPDETISAAVRTVPIPRTVDELYLDLIKRSLTRTLSAKFRERHTFRPGRLFLRVLNGIARAILAPVGLEVVRVIETDADDYLESGDAALNRVEDAETMLGTRQLDSMQACIADILDRGVPGDLLEAGVWRGGMTVFMRAVLKARQVTDRRVWVVDSFAGLPRPDSKFDTFGWRAGDMAASLGQVKSNFDRYGLLDDQVVFVKGFFSQTLPGANIPGLAIVRLDADLYESTKDALDNLYSKLSVGGYAVFDDYQNLPDCRRAIEEFRQAHGITDPIIKIDRRAAYWQKTGSGS